MTSPESPLIALVSAVPAAIPPAVAAFAEEFPDARIWNIIDDRLLTEVDERGGLTDELAERMTRLIRHAVTEGADGVLVTCSVYGSVVPGLTGVTVPVLASDDAAFAAVLTGGFHSVLLLSPAPNPLKDSVSRLTEAAAASGADIEIAGAVAEGAPAAAASGDVDELTRILHETYLSSGAPVDAVLLGQYSLAPAGARLAELIDVPVLTAPGRAAAALRAALETPGQA